MNVGVDALVLEATAAVVDDFDSRLIRLLKQDIFRFQITMYNLVVALELKGLQDLDGEPADEACRHALEVVLLDELVEIYAKEFK